MAKAASILTTPARTAGRLARDILGAALSPLRSGEIASEDAHLDAPQTLHLTSSAFGPGKRMPKRYTAAGANRSPPLRWSGVPKRAASLALICEDPDAPKARPFVHWMIWNIPAGRKKLRGDVARKRRPAGTSGAVQGRNGKGRRGYFGPLPPRGHGTHHYHFQLFALDRKLKLKPGASRKDLVKAMRGHVLAEGHLVGTARRK